MTSSPPQQQQQQQQQSSNNSNNNNNNKHPYSKLIEDDDDNTSTSTNTIINNNLSPLNTTNSFTTTIPLVPAEENEQTPTAENKKHNNNNATTHSSPSQPPQPPQPHSQHTTTTTKHKPRPLMGINTNRYADTVPQYYQGPFSANDVASSPTTNHRSTARKSIKVFDHIVDEIIPAHARKKKDRKGKQRLGPSSIFEVYETTVKPPSSPARVASTENHIFTAGDAARLHAPPMTADEYDATVDSVRVAIDSGTQPTRISQGSSGSYFCRNADGKIVGVFKPKNEEPYGHLNPKWAKWIHRNCFPCCFGRSCLIPNLGYVSEAAASLIDRRLGFNIVPRTDIVYLSSPSFHYSYLDRRAAKDKQKPKPLPEKIGSFQIFLHQFKDANVFLREHPHTASRSSADKNRLPPESSIANDDEDEHPEGGSAEHLLGAKQGRSRSMSEHLSSSLDDSRRSSVGRASNDKFEWTEPLSDQFRDEFEKLVILDYLIRNTDRGLDNWMIRSCGKKDISDGDATPRVRKSTTEFPDDLAIDRLSIDDPVNLDRHPSFALGTTKHSRASFSENDLRSIPEVAQGIKPSSSDRNISASTSRSSPPSSRAASKSNGRRSEESLGRRASQPHIHLAAIDNGLAFPWKHPDRWRTYPYGWLFLSPDLIHTPFSQATRDALLPILTSPQWWRQTVSELRRLFSVDSDFQEDMFERQAAILKGQGWNIVEVLRRPGSTPFQLVKRVAVAVWEEEVVIVESDDDDDDDDDYDDYEDYDGYDGYGATVEGDARNVLSGDENLDAADRSGPPRNSRRPFRPHRRRSADFPTGPDPRSRHSSSWRGKMKSRLSMDATNFDRHRHSRRRPTVKKRIIERLEEFTRARPWFTWC